MSLWRRIYLERRAVVLPLVVLLVANVAALALAVFPLKRSVASPVSWHTSAARITTGFSMSPP